MAVFVLGQLDLSFPFIRFNMRCTAVAMVLAFLALRGGASESQLAARLQSDAAHSNLVQWLSKNGGQGMENVRIGTNAAGIRGLHGARSCLCVAVPLHDSTDALFAPWPLTAVDVLSDEAPEKGLLHHADSTEAAPQPDNGTGTRLLPSPTETQRRPEGLAEG